MDSFPNPSFLKVAFLTGRQEPQRNATALNLQRRGLIQYETLILRSEGEYNMTAQERSPLKAHHNDFLIHL